tara:strand:- start:1667 stop:1915 length:249 start_codon:yes stop_codon:yes gene_type:complete
MKINPNYEESVDLQYELACGLLLNCSVLVMPDDWALEVAVIDGTDDEIDVHGLYEKSTSKHGVNYKSVHDAICEEAWNTVFG